MKSCPYCGGRYSDDVTVCPADQYELANGTESKKEGKIQVACPACGTQNDFKFVVNPRSSFSWPAFLAGGLFAVLFRNVSRGRKVRCNRCETGFYIRSPFSKLSLVIFWLLVSPTVIVLIAFLIYLIVAMFSH